MKKIYYLDENLKGISSLVDELIDDGYDVTKFKRDGALFAELEKGNIPDLLILDIMMPSEMWPDSKTNDGKRTGILVLKELKEQGFGIPTLVYSVVDDVEVINEAKKYGIIDYLVKPVLPSDVMSMVKSILG